MLIASIAGILILLGFSAIYYFIDWDAAAPKLVLLVAALMLLSWATTLLPGPVKRVGKAGGRWVLKGMMNRDKRK